jgi:hypothetical protein
MEMRAHRGARPARGGSNAIHAAIDATINCALPKACANAAPVTRPLPCPVAGLLQCLVPPPRPAAATGSRTLRR